MIPIVYIELFDHEESFYFDSEDEAFQFIEEITKRTATLADEDVGIDVGRATIASVEENLRVAEGIWSVLEID